eukprot:1178678-Prorocentrum_minimum.AAC.4
MENQVWAPMDHYYKNCTTNTLTGLHMRKWVYLLGDDLKCPARSGAAAFCHDRGGTAAGSGTATYELDGGCRP